MALKCGFFNSVDHDRKYDSEDFSRLINAIITDGVIATQGELFTTIPGEGLQVLVKPGYAWFNSTWSMSEVITPLTIETADVTRARIDAVVLEVDSSTGVRNNRLFILKGTPSTSPMNPTLTNTETLHQHALAYVTVPAAATKITAANINIRVGQSDCPFALGKLESVSIDDLFNQWEGEFDAWFENLQSQLSDNVVTNLQQQINERVKVADKATDADINAGTPNKWVDAEDLSVYQKAGVGLEMVSGTRNVSKLMTFPQLTDAFASDDARWTFYKSEKVDWPYPEIQLCLVPNIENNRDEFQNGSTSTYGQWTDETRTFRMSMLDGQKWSRNGYWFVWSDNDLYTSSDYWFIPNGDPVPYRYPTSSVIQYVYLVSSKQYYYVICWQGEQLYIDRFDVGADKFPVMNTRTLVYSKAGVTSFECPYMYAAYNNYQKTAPKINNVYYIWTFHNGQVIENDLSILSTSYPDQCYVTAMYVILWVSSSSTIYGVRADETDISATASWATNPIYWGAIDYGAYPVRDFLIGDALGTPYVYTSVVSDFMPVRRAIVHNYSNNSTSMYWSYCRNRRNYGEDDTNSSVRVVTTIYTQTPGCFIPSYRTNVVDFEYTNIFTNSYYENKGIEFPYDAITDTTVTQRHTYSYGTYVEDPRTVFILTTSDDCEVSVLSVLDGHFIYKRQSSDSNNANYNKMKASVTVDVFSYIISDTITPILLRPSNTDVPANGVTIETTYVAFTGNDPQVRIDGLTANIEKRSGKKILRMRGSVCLCNNTTVVTSQSFDYAFIIRDVTRSPKTHERNQVLLTPGKIITN